MNIIEIKCGHGAVARKDVQDVVRILQDKGILLKLMKV